jgi:hypothetical protein
MNAAMQTKQANLLMTPPARFGFRASS